MGDTGLEQSPLAGSKTPILETGGTESGTVESGGAFNDSDLEAIVEAWPTLPGNIKLAIKALVG